jgi:hypothetical protein
MKFSLAWANIAAQNVTLKIGVLALSIVSVFLGATTVKLALKKPLIIERACFSKAIESENSSRTAAEVEIFIREAIHERFDSDGTPLADYLSPEETSNRVQEQKELTSRNMRQTVLVRAVKVDGDAAMIDCDRIISVGLIRSALSYPLSVNIATTTRSTTNPYGLQVTKIAIPKPEEHK